MRTRSLPVLSVLLVLLLGACGSSSGKAEPPLAFLSAGDDVVAIRPEAGAIEFRAPGAVAAGDGSRIFSARSRGSRTALVGLDPATGRREWSTSLMGSWSVAAASFDGRAVAVGRPRPTGEAYPPGRQTTPLVVFDGPDGEPRRFDLMGNYEPEAFTSDRTGLFVIEYTPSMAPTEYRVRQLDLRSGQVQDVYSVDKELQESMGGSARTQAWAPDGRRLYTLYTLDQPGHHRQAFVHVLSLDERWAHCVDLPAPFGKSPESAAALAVSPDGRRVYVTDGRSGRIAEVDTEHLTVTRSAPLLKGSPSTAAAAVGRDGRLYAAQDSEVVAVEIAGLVALRRWAVPGLVSALRVAPGDDVDRLLLTVADRVLVLDPTSGERVASVVVDGVDGFGAVGNALGGAHASGGPLECAC